MRNNDIVTVYHGTTLAAAKKIIAQKEIHTTTSENKRYDDTENGVVYVTKCLCDAMDFSTRPKLGFKECCIVVFRIQINKNELRNDPDEKRLQSTLTQNGYTECYRINRNLTLGKDVDAIFIKDFATDYRQLGSYMQKVQCGEIKIIESNWMDI